MDDGVYSVYILTNKRHTVLYVGVTGRLEQRIFEHKNKLVKSFSSKYNTDQLVYIERLNPEWKDLSDRF